MSAPRFLTWLTWWPIWQPAQHMLKNWYLATITTQAIAMRVRPGLAEYGLAATSIYAPLCGEFCSPTPLPAKSCQTPTRAAD